MSMIGADSSAVMHKAVLKKQYGMVSPPSGTSAPSCLQLGPLDGFNLRLWFLESTHFFQESLDTDAIKSSLEQLLARYPSFAGRAKKRTARRQKGKGEVEGEVAADHKNIWKGYQVVVDENCGVPLVEIELPGTAADAANDPALWHSRGLASIPSLSDVINGAAETTTKTSPPLMTVVVTQFSGGGSALGVAVNHGLVDGKGYAELLKTWSLGHRLGWDHADVAKLQVARPQFLLQSSCAPASDDVVFDTRTQAECDTFCRVTEPTIWRSAGQARARIYFTWAELRDFKANTACYEREIKPACPTSTEALAARVWCAFFERVLRSAAPTDRAIQPQLMTQMRCPRNPQIPSNFLGNCVEGLYSPLIQVDSNTKTLQPDLRTLLCTGFRAAGALMEDDASKHVMITKLSQKISNILAGFWGSSAAGSKKMQGAGKHDDSIRIDLFGVNAMQSFRVFGLNFGLNDSVGYIPHNLGCPFQIEEASGGVYVLLQVPPWAKSSAPSDWLEQVESLAFRDSVSSI